MTAHSFSSAPRSWARQLSHFSLLPACVLAGASAAQAATINVPADQPTIQAAANAAASGDTILLADGTYTGPGNYNILFGNKQLTVTSQHGAAYTSIDCGHNNRRCFGFYSGEQNAMVSGLTLKNGNLNGAGGAVFVHAGESAIFTACVFAGNSCSVYGGAISNNGTLTLINCVFTQNANSQGSSINNQGTVTLDNCTFSANTSSYNGCLDNQGTATLTNCLLYGDTGVEISGSAAATNCDIQGGYSGTNNINADPLFASATDFHLQPGSPCLGTGTSTGAPAADLDGTTRSNPPSIGAYDTAPAVATTTTTVSSLNPSVAGQNVTFTTTVAAATGTATPTGSVQFTVDGTNAGSPISLDNTGTAAYAVTAFSAGNHTITAVYTPTGGFSASTSSPLTQSVTSAFVPTYDALWTAGNGEFSVWEAALGGGFVPHDFDAVSGYTAQALAVTPDSHAHVLLTATSGAICLSDMQISTLLRDHNSASLTSYGPFAGWTAQTLAAGADGSVHVLWTSTSGQMSLWKVHSDGTYDHAEYGPYPGWNARFLSAAPDSTLRVLWTHTSGEVSFWVMDSAGGFQNFEYGPYPGWTPSALATGPDGLSHLTWSHAGDGLASLWSLSDSGLFAFVNFGPYTDWNVGAVAVSANGTLHLGWSETNGTASLWDISATSPSSFTDTHYGPYGNWQLQSLSAAP